MKKRTDVPMMIGFIPNAMLTELSAKRKGEGGIIRTKKDIAAEAIADLYKREFKE